MARKQYPVKGLWHSITLAVRPNCKKCTTCKIAFKPKEEFFVRDTEVSVFRGDDKTEACHEGCRTP